MPIHEKKMMKPGRFCGSRKHKSRERKKEQQNKEENGEGSRPANEEGKNKTGVTLS